MKILILGGDGMLGHQLLKRFRNIHEVMVTLRQDAGAYQHLEMFNNKNTFFGVDVRFIDKLVEVMACFRPDVVINAVGIVKQRSDARESLPSLEINSLLPHRLSLLCSAVGARLIHLSTDCVFSGDKGDYIDEDPSDARDLYGKTKYLGEVGYKNSLTLRTSIIGPELTRHSSLFDWFTSQRGTVNGFTNAIYSGFTTIEMANIIEKIITRHPAAFGIYNVSSEKIDKYSLLVLIRDVMGLNIEIVPNNDFKCDRSLNSDRFRMEFDYTPPTWEEMVRGLR